MSLPWRRLFVSEVAVAICVWLFLVGDTAAGEKPTMVDLGWGSIEHAETRLSLSGRRAGVLVARCYGCAGDPWLRLRINGHSKVFLNRQEIAFEQAIGLIVDFESVHYEFEGLVLREWHLTNLD